LPGTLWLTIVPSSFAALHKKGLLPTLPQLLEGRKSKENYRIFCQHFVIGVVGSALFKRSYCNTVFSSFCSVSDEAMTFLILDNNWDAWIEMAEADAKGEKLRLMACTKQQKYFDGQGRSKSWSLQGRTYFNELFGAVVADRDSYGRAFDEYFMACMQNDTEEGLRMMKDKRKPQDAPKDAIISCRNDYVPIAARRAAEVTDAVNNMDNHSDERGNGSQGGLGNEKRKQRNGRLSISSKKVGSTSTMNSSSSIAGSNMSLVANGNGYVQASNVTIV
jgi:hypothetical protein